MKLKKIIQRFRILFKKIKKLAKQYKEAGEELISEEIIPFKKKRHGDSFLETLKDNLIDKDK